MSESVQFWLDNKMSAGIRVAAIGDQLLVVYREKFYVVEQGAAHTKGGKPVRYSKTSMPAIWKRALRGEVLSPDTLIIPADDALPESTVTRRERVRKKAPPPAVTPAAVQPLAFDQPAAFSASAAESKPHRNVKKMDTKAVVQTSVAAVCPHCNHRYEIPLEKGKNGKPFFMACSRCKAEFAVRFVPVVVYQAQVAAFR